MKDKISKKQLLASKRQRLTKLLNKEFYFNSGRGSFMFFNDFWAYLTTAQTCVKVENRITFTKGEVLYLLRRELGCKFSEWANQHEPCGIDTNEGCNYRDCNRVVRSDFDPKHPDPCMVIKNVDYICVIYGVTPRKKKKHPNLPFFRRTF